MFSFHLTKFFAVFALVFLLFSGCGLWQKSGRENSSPAPAVSDDLRSAIPFSSEEPERFQAEIVLTTGATERKTFIARNGSNRRYDFNFGAKNQLTNLQTDKNYLILQDKKLYAEMLPAQNSMTDEWADSLTTEWLSEKTDASFEKIETIENITKYRVRFGENNAFEVLIYIDEAAKLPVKQEFYSISGEQEILNYKMELRNLKLQTDENLFAVPNDFKKVSEEEFRKSLRGEQ